MSWFPDGMTPVDAQLPGDPHLLQDINVPEQAVTEELDSTKQAASTASLNARQQVPGVSPVDQYREGGNPEGQADGKMPSPEES